VHFRIRYFQFSLKEISLKKGGTQMVKRKRENTVKSAENQGNNKQSLKPAKIKADTEYELCNARMTAFGGLLALVKFVDLVNFQEVFERTYCSPSRKPELGCYKMIYGLLMLLFIGFARIGHLWTDRKFDI
jgi:hypothetical protein